MVTPSLIQIYIPQKIPLPKLKGNRKTQTHTCIYVYLYRYVYTGIYYISPLWHKNQEQKRSFARSKGFSVQLFVPEGQARQGRFNIEIKT